MSDPYPPIGSLGAIGDGHSLALLDPGGGVQWYCPLRLDADPVIWPLLDARRGGRLRVGPAGPADTSCSYLGGTAVLAYGWETSTGRAAARVGMVFPNRGGQDLIWVLDGLAGEVELEVVLDPRPGFGRVETDLRPVASGTQVIAGAGLRLTLAGPPELRQARARAPPHCDHCGRRPDGLLPPHGVRLVARAGSGAAGGVRRGARRDGRRLAGLAKRHRLRRPRARRGAAQRHHPQAAHLRPLRRRRGGGDDVAARARRRGPQLGLPVHVAARRQLHAQRALPAAVHPGGPPLRPLDVPGRRRPRPALRVLYGVGGESEFPEYELDDVEGYRGSRPVRVGNGAEHQLDGYGELLDCLTICEVLGDDVMREEWPLFRRLVEFCAQHWRDPDSGIWEVRDRSRHFVHSKVMAWTALDRGCNLVEQLGLSGDVDRWRAEADRLRHEILASALSTAVSGAPTGNLISMPAS